MDEFFLVKQIQVWTTDLFHSEIKICIYIKQYIKSSERQEIAA